MERRSKIIVLAFISLVAAVGLTAVAYAQTNRVSTTGQCGSMMGSGRMGMMGATGGMMGQSSNMQANCQSMTGQAGMPPCQNVAQCPGMMSQENLTQGCH